MEAKQIQKNSGIKVVESIITTQGNSAKRGKDI